MPGSFLSHLTVTVPRHTECQRERFPANQLFAISELPLKHDELLNRIRKFGGIPPPPSPITHFVSKTAQTSEFTPSPVNSLRVYALHALLFIVVRRRGRQLRTGPVLISWCNWYHKSAVINHIVRDGGGRRERVGMGRPLQRVTPPVERWCRMFP